MSQRRPFVGGNWKMNLDLARCVDLAEDVTAGLGSLEIECDVVLCPPHPYLQAVGHALKHHCLGLGGQDVSEHPEGAHTRKGPRSGKVPDPSKPSPPHPFKR